MGVRFVVLLPALCFDAPFVAIAVILLYYHLLRRRTSPKGGRNRGFTPSSAALGVALMFAQIFHRPCVAHAVVSMRIEDVKESESGDPDSIHRQLHRQLRRIRLGERIETLFPGL